MDFFYILFAFMLIGSFVMLITNMPTTRRKYGPVENRRGEKLTVYMNKFPSIFSDWHIFTAREDETGFIVRSPYETWYGSDYAENKFAEQVREVKRECVK